VLAANERRDVHPALGWHDWQPEVLLPASGNDSNVARSNPTSDMKNRHDRLPHAFVKQRVCRWAPRASCSAEQPLGFLDASGVDWLRKATPRGGVLLEHGDQVIDRVGFELHVPNIARAQKPADLVGSLAENSNLEGCEVFNLVVKVEVPRR
jgi:hypothetical protein